MCNFQVASSLCVLINCAGVDVLFNNAAIMAFKDQPKQDGLEQQMLTNHLSHFLLT